MRTHVYDATETDGHQAFADAVFAEGPLDLVISAAGVLIPQEEAEREALAWMRGRPMAHAPLFPFLNQLPNRAAARWPAASQPAEAAPASVQAEPAAAQDVLLGGAAEAAAEPAMPAWVFAGAVEEEPALALPPDVGARRTSASFPTR